MKKRESRKYKQLETKTVRTKDFCLKVHQSKEAFAFSLTSSGEVVRGRSHTDVMDGSLDCRVTDRGVTLKSILLSPEERLPHLMLTLPQGALAGADGNGRIWIYNSKGEKLFGLSSAVAKDFDGETCTQLRSVLLIGAGGGVQWSILQNSMWFYDRTRVYPICVEWGIESAANDF